LRFEPAKTTDAPVWRVRGVLLPDDEVHDLYLVGDRVTLQPQRGAQTLTEHGFILPGLIDAHCHIGLRTSGTPAADLTEAKALATANRSTGVLGIRDAGSPLPYPQLDDDPDMPRLVRAGRHLAPPGRYVPTVAAECTPAQLPAAVTAEAAAGNGWIKLVADFFDPKPGDIAANWTPTAVQDAIRLAHRLGVRVAAHTLGHTAIEPLITAGVDSIEHGTGLTEPLIDLMARNGTALVPTMLAVDSMRHVAAVAETSYPAYTATLRGALERFPHLVRDAHDAGVPIYIGTDAGCEVRHGRIVEEILTLHRRTGIPAGELLASASWRARDWLNLGQLTEGGPADLTIYDHDPRRDLAALRAPTRVVLRGRVVR
jgi:imidazolonepropionase-like amidohydrolase